ncbi:putative long-chain-fatty-acid--CoA ligase [Rosa chinensis]|uniref:Putative long-chain-fatty-acid--CoA ligase n=1 Tax=Rosa chinensis TaxID=74649 RepID=A0A2P6PNR4_ROSCH|nr:putative long-chain-fatty-acid--CoA ligase [Rosa chinensis]
MSEVLSADHSFVTDRVGAEEDSNFSFLPLAHIYGQIIESYCIYKGSSIGFWQGISICVILATFFFFLVSLSKLDWYSLLYLPISTSVQCDCRYLQDVRFLLDDLQELKPTMFCGVPRVYDRIYTGIASKVSSDGVLRKTLFRYAYNYKLAKLEKLVFNKIKQALGGRVRIMLSGAAPLPRHVEEFFRVTSCSTLSQGYEADIYETKSTRVHQLGLTESCGGCFTSIGNVYPMIGTVGVPLTTIEARLESVP